MRKRQVPRYYQYGYQPHNYQSGWQGHPQPSRRAAESRALSDVTDPAEYAFDVPRTGSPYYLHRKEYEREPEFFVPKADSPYWIHKHEWPSPVGALDLPRLSVTTWFLIGVGAVVAHRYRKEIASAFK